VNNGSPGVRSTGTRPDPSEELDALRNREAWAVEHWLLSQQPALERILIHLGASPDQVPELVQEVFVAAIESLPSFRGDAKITTWLYSIARNIVYARSRRSSREKTLEPSDLDYASAMHRARPETDEKSAQWDRPSDPVIRREHREVIDRALNRLPDHYATVIRLRDLEGFSTAETADRLDLTRVNVRVRLHRARSSLGELLQPYFASTYG
jgi:RNA polymerase sigma-70 factor (ECF subfamily)